MAEKAPKVKMPRAKAAAEKSTAAGMPAWSLKSDRRRGERRKTGVRRTEGRRRGAAQKVRVALGAQAYDIFVGEGLLAEAGRRIAQVLPGARLCVVTDRTVARLHLRAVEASLRGAGFRLAPPLVLAAGEQTKSFTQLERLVDHGLKARLDRGSALVALGGGVVGDLTGFAAAVLLRGIHYIQLPTTLLAQVDSSVGGKTAINTSRGKNLVGAFHQPRLVLADTGALRTLPERELKAGYAEILKYALIDDEAFFGWLELNGRAVLALEPAAAAEAVRASCAAKARVVAADEREKKDIRALLNLGHTFGHALESIYKYDGRLLHGEAVGIGLRLAYDFSAEQGLCPAAEARAVERHLRSLGLMTAPPAKLGVRRMVERMRGDKKAANGRLALVLVRGIGRAYLEKNVDEAALTRFLEQRLFV
jgi:3-dehydroquinate synthase